MGRHQAFQLGPQRLELLPEAGMYRAAQLIHRLWDHLQVAKPIGCALGAAETHQHQIGAGGNKPLGRILFDKITVLEAPGLELALNFCLGVVRQLTS